jgi:hypothetical protein
MDPLMARMLTAAAGKEDSMEDLLRQWIQQWASHAAPPQEEEAERLAIRLRRQNRRLEERLEAALGFLKALADLMGACPRCFGQDKHCPRCRGAGSPGSRSPDPELAGWVKPAFHRLGYRVVPRKATELAAEAVELSQYEEQKHARRRV